MTRDKGFYRSFFILTITLMLEQAVVLSVNLADNLMLGNYSEVALSGVAAVNQIQFILQQMIFAISNGVIILASQYQGKGSLDAVRKVASIGLWCGVVVMAVVFVIVSVSPEGVLSIFTPDKAIIAEGAAYLKVVRFSYPFFAITTMLLAALRSIESVRIAVYGSVVALVINCSINFLLIGGRLGCPELGAVGAAIGTLAARVLECALVAFYLFRVEKKLRCRVRDFLHVDLSLLRDFIRVTTPVFVTGFLWGCSNALHTVILGNLSSNAIAAYSISSTIFLFLKAASVGASSSASILVGKTVGEGDMNKVKEYSRTLQVLFVSIGVAMSSVLLLIRNPLMSMYAVSPETYSMANSFIFVEAVVLVTMSYQMCVNTGIIRGGGDTKFIMIVDLISIWGIVIPVSFMAAFVWELSPIVVFICLNADQCFKCIPAAIRCNSYRWIRNLTKG